MTSLIRMASMAAALSLASPLSAATVTYDFEAIGSDSNPDGRLIGQLRFDLDNAPLFAEDRFITVHSDVGQIDAIITGGRQDGGEISSRNVSLFGFYSTFANALFATGETASMVLSRWNEPFFTESDLTIFSFSSGAIWVRPDNLSEPSPERYALTTLSAPRLVSVPLPATFPLFLGVCLGAAFFGRRSSQA